MESQERQTKVQTLHLQALAPKEKLDCITTTLLGCYLWQGFHPQFFILKNFFFGHIIPESGQNSILVILLLASTEPIFHFLFLFSLSCIPIWFLAKIHFKGIVCCVPLDHTHRPHLCPTFPEICPRTRQVTLWQHWTDPRVAWPGVDIRHISWMLSKKPQGLHPIELFMLEKTPEITKSNCSASTATSITKLCP